MTAAENSNAPFITRTPLAFLHQPDVALFLIRGILGVVGIFHGAQKLFGWFGGKGIDGFAGFLATLNIPLPLVSAYMAASAEFFGGLLLIVGLATRVSAFFFGFTMLVAILTVHNSAFDARNSGMEYPLTLMIILTALIFSGAGRYSLDALVANRRIAPTATRSTVAA